MTKQNITGVDDPHYPATMLVSVENTHNMCGGVPLPVEYMDAMGALCARPAAPRVAAPAPITLQ